MILRPEDIFVANFNTTVLNSYCRLFARRWNNSLKIYPPKTSKFIGYKVQINPPYSPYSLSSCSSFSLLNISTHLIKLTHNIQMTACPFLFLLFRILRLSTLDYLHMILDSHQTDQYYSQSTCPLDSVQMPHFDFWLLYFWFSSNWITSFHKRLSTCASFRFLNFGFLFLIFYPHQTDI